MCGLRDISDLVLCRLTSAAFGKLVVVLELSVGTGLSPVTSTLVPDALASEAGPCGLPAYVLATLVALPITKESSRESGVNKLLGLSCELEGEGPTD